MKVTEFTRFEMLHVDYYEHSDGEWIGDYSEELQIPIRYRDIQQGIIDLAIQKGIENFNADWVYILDF